MALSLLASSCSTLPQGTFQEWQDPPAIGKTIKGDSLFLGGVSGICCTTRTGDEIQFTSLTDRGPNADSVLDWKGVGKNVRPFVLPSFHPEILRFSWNLKTKKISLIERIPLHDKSGRPMTGLPPYSPQDSSPRKMELATDANGKILGTDFLGVDSEAICRGEDGSFWISEEYGPDLMHFDAQGTLLDRFTPGRGLPPFYQSRRSNRGFEGLACAGGKVYGILQSPLPLKDAKNQIVIRLFEFDPKARRTSGVYLYLLEPQKDLTELGLVDKIGDLAHIKDKKFLVVEQNAAVGEQGVHNVYEIDLEGAVNLLDAPSKSIEPEMLIEADARKLGAVKKKFVLDLVKAGFRSADKMEGLGLVDEHSLLVVSDNDFGLAKGTDPNQVKVMLDPSRKTTFGLFEISKDPAR